jgi:hypothetical protein
MAQDPSRTPRPRPLLEGDQGESLDPCRRGNGGIHYMRRCIHMNEEDRRRQLFRNAADRIGKIWPQEEVTLFNLSFEDKLKRDHPAAFKRFEDTQEALNTVWVACLHDMASIAQFKASLADWEHVRVRCVELVKKEP